MIEFMWVLLLVFVQGSLKSVSLYRSLSRINEAMLGPEARPYIIENSRTLT